MCALAVIKRCIKIVIKVRESTKASDKAIVIVEVTLILSRKKSNIVWPKQKEEKWPCLQFFSRWFIGSINGVGGFVDWLSYCTIPNLSFRNCAIITFRSAQANEIRNKIECAVHTVFGCAQNQSKQTEHRTSGDAINLIVSVLFLHAATSLQLHFYCE